MRLDAVMRHLESEGVGTAGDSIFINFIPADKSGILLRHPFGGLAVQHDLPGYYKGTFMLISRARGFQESMALTEAAIDALKKLVGQKEVEGVLFNYARPRSKPFPYAPSPGQQNELHSTIECCYVDTSESAG